MCPDIRSIFETGSAELIHDLLSDDTLTEQEGLALMRQLQVARPAVFNRVLCHFYDIVCYLTGDTCFVDTTPPGDHDKWFVGVPVDEEFAFDPEAAPDGLFATCAEAEAAVVAAYQLDAVFFGAALTKASA